MVSSYNCRNVSNVFLLGDIHLVGLRHLAGEVHDEFQ